MQVIDAQWAEVERPDRSGVEGSITRPPGDYAVRELLTGVTAPGLTVDENGGFSGYMPLKTFAPREGYILLLEPAGDW